ncbi:MAG: gephyrin-like molybdotransferase Glp [Pseudomonadota bacterium]
MAGRVHTARTQLRTALRRHDMLSVDAARDRILDGVVPIAKTERVALIDAVGRTLAQSVSATVDQPPFAASAMDGYAVRSVDLKGEPPSFRVIGEAAAGHRFSGCLGEGEAVRIFTGAPVPDGADAIIIQENVARDGATIHVVDGVPNPAHIRPQGGDYGAGTSLLPAGRKLTSRDITLAASLGHAQLDVRMKPVVAILATGDELVAPGEVPNADQIVCSNPFGIAAIIETFGGRPKLLGIAKDTRDDLNARLVDAAGADVLVTIGGASVGDHDLVAGVMQSRGMELDFWKIAMRPGKPLMFGRLGDTRMIGLPGNPVSSLICSRLFVAPLVERLLGLPGHPPPLRSAILGCGFAANGPRAHYMRGQLVDDDGPCETVVPSRSQDSSLLSVLSAADLLIVRPPNDPPRNIGSPVMVMALDY